MASWLLSIGTAQSVGPADELSQELLRSFPGASDSHQAALCVHRSADALCLSAGMHQCLICIL